MAVDDIPVIGFVSVIFVAIIIMIVSREFRKPPLLDLRNRLKSAIKHSMEQSDDVFVAVHDVDQAAKVLSRMWQWKVVVGPPSDDESCEWLKDVKHLEVRGFNLADDESWRLYVYEGRTNE